MNLLETNEILINALEQIASFGTAPQDAAHLVDVGADKYLKYFEEEIIEDIVSYGGATCKFYEGVYGSGKSHILNLLRELAFDKGMVVASTDLSQAIGFTDWKLVTEYILQNMEMRSGNQITRSLPEILAALGKYEIGPNIEKLKGEYLPCPGFTNAMVYATQKDSLDNETWELLKQYLLGHKISVVSLRDHGLIGIKGNLTKRNSEFILKTALGALYYLGVTGTVLLFDENEKTLIHSSRAPSKKYKEAANLIRRMIDGCSNGLMVGTAVVFAVLPGFLGNCNMHYQALGQRINIVQDGLHRPAWRWPLISVEFINSAYEPEDFLEKAVKLYVSIVKKIGGNVSNLESIMLSKGQETLESNVGSGYKRELMKILSDIALERL